MFVTGGLPEVLTMFNNQHPDAQITYLELLALILEKGGYDPQGQLGAHMPAVAGVTDLLLELKFF